MSASCGAPVQTTLQPAQPCPSPDLGSSQMISAPDSQGSEPASQPLPQTEQRQQSALLRVTRLSLARSKGQPETGLRRAAHIQQHHAGIFPLRSLSLTPSLSLTSSLSSCLSLSLSPPLSYPFFLKMQSCALAASVSFPPNQPLLYPYHPCGACIFFFSCLPLTFVFFMTHI